MSDTGDGLLIDSERLGDVEGGKLQVGSCRGMSLCVRADGLFSLTPCLSLSIKGFQ